MTIKLSQRVGRVKPSPTLAITARAAEMKAAGHDVIGLGAGEPDFHTPDNIKAAGIKAIEEGRTTYAPVTGLPELKDAIIKKFKRDNNLDYEQSQLVVTVGGKQSQFNLFQAVLDEGDEVIIPAPYWVSYPAMVKLAGGEPVILETDIDSEFRITPEQLEAAITDKTRIIVLNSPSNPSSQVYSKKELEALGQVIAKYPDILVATDDMYEHIRWTGEPFSNIVNAVPELYDQTVVLNGVSKAYAMTGWRIGFAAGPEHVIKAIAKIQSQQTSGATTISQVAAAEALAGDQSRIGDMVKEFEKRGKFVVEALNAITGVRCLPSQGAFYAFADFSKVIENIRGVSNDVELAEYFLRQAKVAVVPGSAFGSPGYIRLSYATSMENLQKAMVRITAASGTEM